ncbi:MAG: hypothetical protein GX874_10365 [Smithella sp.]|nr:hypothetical protein [Smithella sp.]
MPPRKSTAPKPRGPPRTPPELRSLKASISFRADQKAYLDRLKAVDLDAELEALPDSVRDDVLEAAAVRFFDELILVGSYAISQNELIRHEATADEMRLDAEALGIPVGKLIPALQDLWDLEKEYALRKAAVLRKYRNSEKRP